MKVGDVFKGYAYMRKDKDGNQSLGIAHTNEKLNHKIMFLDKKQKYIPCTLHWHDFVIVHDTKPSEPKKGAFIVRNVANRCEKCEKNIIPEDWKLENTNKGTALIHIPTGKLLMYVDNWNRHNIESEINRFYCSRWKAKVEKFLKNEYTPEMHSYTPPPSAEEFFGGPDPGELYVVSRKDDLYIFYDEASEGEKRLWKLKKSLQSGNLDYKELDHDSGVSWWSSLPSDSKRRYVKIDTNYEDVLTEEQLRDFRQKLSLWQKYHSPQAKIFDEMWMDFNLSRLRWLIQQPLLTKLWYRLFNFPEPLGVRFVYEFRVRGKLYDFTDEFENELSDIVLLKRLARDESFPFKLKQVSYKDVQIYY